MQNNITFKRTLSFCAVLMLIFSLSMSTANLNAQVISTASGTNYLGNYSVNNTAPLVITFNVKNTSAASVQLTNVSTQMAPYFSTAGEASAITLFYSATSLSGPPTVGTPAWTQIGTGTATVPAALAVVPVISGLTFVIPANTEYRFGLEVTRGLAFSFTPTPTPNEFTNGAGITLRVGDAQVAGLNVGYAGLFPTPAVGNTPAFFGGSITVSSTVACTGTPAPGNTVSTAASVCPGTPFTLSAQNPTVGTGVTYQWQSSSAAGGPFTNIPGATNPTYTVTTLAANTYYQVIVTCGGNSGTSTPVLVSATPASGCYCTPTASTFGCNSGDLITNVTFGGINNTSACGNGGTVSGYSNYTTSVAAGTLFRGANNPISVNFPGGFTEFVGVWVDYNQSGTFDPAEFTLLGSSATGGPLTGNINIPANAPIGATRVRIKLNFNTAPAATSACTGSGFGEIEDYTVNIIDCVPLTVTTPPANATISCGGNATFTVSTAGSLPTYQWQYRTSPTGVWMTVPNAAPFSGVNTSTLTITNAPVSFNGYQFRAVFTGACSGPDFSAPATLTVNPLVLAVTPTTANYCSVNGTPVLITVPNSSNTVTFTNNTASPIPDASATGTHTDNIVTGVPAGANILRILVTFNITHPYVGDLVVNLKGPNNNVLNLVAFLDNGTGSNATANFVGTGVASDGTVALSGAPAPRTGTNFKADAILVAGGPTGGIANVTTWASFLTLANANGTWGLYAADGGATDVGNINSWSIAITYGSSPATAVFTPQTGLYTNAAGTTPYTGGAVSQVYAAPTATTTYTAAVSTATCSAAPSTVTVTVNTPVGGTPTVANATGCNNGTAVFTVTGVTGGPNLTYVWEMSTAANPTVFTTVTNGGGISGATTPTLTITGPTAAMAGNMYRVRITATGCAASTSVTSTAGTLTSVSAPVVVTTVAPTTTLTPGNTTILTTAVSGATGTVTYQYYLNNVLIPGATSNTYVADINNLGFYTVRVTDANGCTAVSTTPIEIVVRAGASNTTYIYPSPNNGTFQVRHYNRTATAAASEPAMLNVFDSKGSRVFTQRYSLVGPYTQMNVNLGTHNSGIYRVELTNSNGERISTGSVMVF